MTITEVSEMYGLSADTLRYYEKIGLIEPITKGARGARDYQPHDVNRIKFLKCMRNAGLGIELLKKYVDLFHEGDETIPERQQMLIQQKAILQAKLDELQETMDTLNYKIDNYDKVLLEKEREVAKGSKKNRN
ncbi:MAG: MerR family transcriptional regulator [Coprobacillaceae bacterium]